MGQTGERPTNATLPERPEERGPDSEASLMGKIGKILAVVLPGLATAVQLTTAVFGIKPVIPLTPLASVLLIAALALFTWQFVAINRKGEAGVQVYLSLMMAALLTVASIAVLGYQNEVPGAALPTPSGDQSTPSSQGQSSASSAIETTESSIPSSSLPVTPTTQSTASPAGASPCPDDPTHQFCGRISIGYSVDLDAEPPSQSFYEASIDLGVFLGEFYSAENTVAATWGQAETPSRAGCDAEIASSGVTGQTMHKVSTGSALCIRTGGGHTAFVRQVKIGEAEIIAYVIVWK